MSTLLKLLLALGVDAKEYDEGLDKAEKKAEGSSKTIASAFSNIGKGMTDIGTKLTAGVTLPLAAAGLVAYNMASDLSETVSKVGVVFGKSADQVLAFGENAAKAMGMSKNEALSAAGTYGNLFRAMGITEQTSADMSTSLVGLAADLASFNNMNPTEVLDKLRAGLSGETEPLKSLGVNLNATAIEAKALSMGLASVEVDGTKVKDMSLKLTQAQLATAKAVKKFGENSLQAQQAQMKEQKALEAYNKAVEGKTLALEPAAKAQATYALILEQTTLAQGDFERTAAGSANQTRIARAQMADLAATIGERLLPIGLKILTWVNGVLTSFSNLSPEMQNTILIVAGLAAAIGPLLVVLGTLFSAIGAISAFLAGPAAAAIGGAIAAALPVIGVVLAIVAALALLYVAWTNNWGGIQEKAAAAWAFLQPIFAAIGNWLSVQLAAAVEWFSNTWTTVLWPAIQKVWGWMSTVLFPFFQAFGNFLGAVFSVALKGLAELWTTVLLPALQSVWSFLTDKVLPLFQELGDYLGSVFGPIIEDAGGLIRNVLGGAFEWATEKLQGLTKWFQGLADLINGKQAEKDAQTGGPGGGSGGGGSGGGGSGGGGSGGGGPNPGPSAVTPPGVSGVRGNGGTVINNTYNMPVYTTESAGTVQHAFTLAELMGGAG